MNGNLYRIKNRHSVRSYQKKDVEEAKIHKLVEAARSAPYAGQFHITVLLDKAILNQLEDLTTEAMRNSCLQFLRDLAETPGFRPLFDAPGMLVFSAPENNPYGMANCANAATTAALAATDMYIGSCFAVTPTLALEQHPEICAKIGMPGGFRPLCCLIFGYTEDPAKGRHPRNLGDNVNYCK